VAVIATNPDLLHQTEWLLSNGAAELLVLAPQASPPQRVLIHWADDAARRSTLAVAASLLRHVPAEAVYLGILPTDGGEEGQRPIGVRTLLDARSEAQAVHGLEMRTELHFGAAAEALHRQLSESNDQMLILGISHLQQLRDQFHDLLRSPIPFSLMIVYRPTKEAETMGRVEAARDIGRDAGGVVERAALP
jgi:hypothetical protein